MASKRPAYQWYPGDFRRDTALQACHFEARSLWREMLDLMHDGEPYGHLTAGGVPISDAELARLIGIPVKKAIAWLYELESRKVFSRTEGGVVYSRRMVKDEQIRNVRAASGRLGGNPNLVNQNTSNGQPLHLPSAVAVASAIAKPPRGQFIDTGEASLLVAKIRALAEDRQTTAQGAVRFVRKERVAELGPEVVLAFDAAGGQERVLGADGREFGYMVRDFAMALKAARAA